MYNKNVSGKMPVSFPSSTKALSVFCIIIWSAVIIMTVFLSLRLHNLNKKVETIAPIVEYVPETNMPDELEIPKDPLKMSIDFCKNRFSNEIGNAVYEASVKHNIPPYVIFAIIATESGRHRTDNINESNIMNVNPRARSSVDCRGLMQCSKYALADYNRINKTEYTMDDLFNISINIEIGTWYYSQFTTVSDSWTEIYVIYNVGYGNYRKVNPYWFYGRDGLLYNDYKNSFFYMNDVYPPDCSYKRLSGDENILRKYNAKKRFEKCLNLCYQYFSN